MRPPAGTLALLASPPDAGEARIVAAAAGPGGSTAAAAAAAGLMRAEAAAGGPLPAQCFLFGTAHVSRRCADDVYRAVLALNPDVVVVELCG